MQKQTYHVTWYLLICYFSILGFHTAHQMLVDSACCSCKFCDAELQKKNSKRTWVFFALLSLSLFPPPLSCLLQFWQHSSVCLTVSHPQWIWHIQCPYPITLMSSYLLLILAVMLVITMLAPLMTLPYLPHPLSSKNSEFASDHNLVFIAAKTPHSFFSQVYFLQLLHQKSHTWNV